MRSIFLAIAIGMTAVASAQTPPPGMRIAPVKLFVGDPAPKIDVEKWLKGAPVDLHDGKVHVVEFWATWCQPCKIGMPHLSELAQKFKGQADFTSISVWEEEETADKTANLVPKVADFVTQAGDMMDYNVAADGLSGKTCRAWMKAAGQHGIPTAFVVDQSGNIAWFGHPLLGLEDVLPLVIQKKFDASASKKIADDWKARQDAGTALMANLYQAENASDYAKVIQLSDKIVADIPWMIGSCAGAKYTALANSDPKAATAYAEDLLRQCANAPLVLTAVAQQIVDINSDIKPPRDYPLGLRLIRQALAHMPSDYTVNVTYAAVLSKTGDAAGAVKAQNDALVIAKGTGLPKLVEEAQKQLDQYKAASKS